MSELILSELLLNAGNPEGILKELIFPSSLWSQQTYCQSPQSKELPALTLHGIDL